MLNWKHRAFWHFMYELCVVFTLVWALCAVNKNSGGYELVGYFPMMEMCVNRKFPLWSRLVRIHFWVLEDRLMLY